MKKFVIVALVVALVASLVITASSSAQSTEVGYTGTLTTGQHGAGFRGFHANAGPTGGLTPTTVSRGDTTLTIYQLLVPFSGSPDLRLGMTIPGYDRNTPSTHPDAALFPDSID